MADSLWKTEDRADRAETETRSREGHWTPRVVLFHEDLAAIDQAIAEATPSDAQLLEWADRSAPPEAWWDEQADPFSPDPSAGNTR